MPKGRLGNVEFTVIAQERIIRETTITDKPVEGLVNIADNAAPRPTQLHITGEITGDRAEASYEKLVKYWEESTILSYTGRTKLTNLVIISFPTDKDAKIGNGFRFNLIAQQIKIAQTQKTTITIPDPVTQVDPAEETESKKDGGLQQPQEAPAISQSFLQKTISWVNGVIFGGNE